MSKNNNGSDEKSARKPQMEQPADTPVFISDRYKIKRVIGGGGVASVYEALDTSLNKLVAIKKLHNASTPVDLIRFQREAKLTSAMTHPNVRSVLDFGLTSKNEPYLVLELAEGQSVSQYLEQHGAMDVETALNILIQVAAGLEHAHNRSIVHRDIKPSNVMLVGGGQRLLAQIVDFGIAKSQTSIQDITGDGVGLGTPHFMSPEQIRGAEIDHRSDIYSFGCLMYQMLTGKPPFEGATILETMKMHTEAPPPALSDKSVDSFSKALESIVQKALAKDPDDRYSSIKELSVDLEKELNLIQALRSERSRSEQSDADLSRYGRLAINEIQHGVGTGSRRLKKAGILVACLIGGMLAVCGVFLLPEYLQSAPPAPTINKTIDPFETYESETHFVKPNKTWTSEEGASSRDLAELAAREQDLSRLNLAIAPLIDAQGLSVLRNKNVQCLTFTDKPVDQKTLSEISKIRSLRRLRLGGKKVFYDVKSLPLLQNLSELGELSLFFVHLDDDVLSSLVKNQKITSLNFESGSGLADAKWELLRPLTKLSVLILNDTDITDASLKRMAALPNLRSVYLKGTNVSDIGLNYLAGLKNIRVIDVTESPKVTSAAVEKLRAKKINVLNERRMRRVFKIPDNTEVGDFYK